MKSKIYWPGLYAVTILNAAILICWIVYHFFQPGLLEKFGYKDAAYTLGLSEAIIFIVIPPISGYLADKFFIQKGNRFIVFTVGISFTSLIFFASAYAFLDLSPQWMKQIIPFLMIFWLIGMNIFYSPATGFILNSVRKEDLPIALALITLSTNLIFAISEPILNLLSVIGNSLIFIVGAILLMGSAYLYIKVSVSEESSEAKNEPIKNNYFRVIIAGLLFGILERIGNKFLPDKIDPFFLEILGEQLTLSMIVYISAAILAFPLCFLLMKYNKGTVFYSSWLISFTALLFLYFFPGTISGIIAAIVLAFSVSSFGVMAFPYALSGIRTESSNFGSGLLLASSGIAAAIITITGY